MRKNIFQNKKVLITGHTGFKGSWLSLWMLKLGAKVLGISKDIPTKPSHFEIIGIKKKIISKKIDIQNLINTKKVIKDFKPDFIFHLAAQAIVKKSYTNPLETWKTNLNGTINILESLKSIKKKITVILVTSDKVYKNVEVSRGYKEGDFLGGVDPYGASKSATEIAINSYIKSFFNKQNNNVRISIARAGNVIGGGDWSENRLIPDCVRAWLGGKKVLIRNLNSTRPWQHVLEVLSGYIRLAIILNNNKKIHGEAFNFGPSSKNYKVEEILGAIKKIWPEIKWKVNKRKIFFENSLLNLNSKKSKELLDWKCKLNFFQTIFLTIEWYRNFKKNKKNKSANMIKSIQQIDYYEKKK
jgi:CDP-glucose 4,6-dehydratase